MTLAGLFQEAFLKYKALERFFLRFDKARDKETYFKLKYRFRMMLMFCLKGVAITTILLINHGILDPIPYISMICMLIGFRTGIYNFPRMMISFFLTVIPTKLLFDPISLVSPVAIVYTNVQVLFQAQSKVATVIHLAIQGLVVYFYGLDKVTSDLQNMSKEELAGAVKAAMQYSLILGFLNFFVMNLFDSQFSNLLWKVSSLKDNLSKANNQLNEQNGKLQSNLEMKDVFIYTFSHELKNALNGLLGNLTLAYETAKDAQVIQFLSSAKVCGEVLKNFVHNILDSGKLENGNLEVSPEKQDVMRFFENAWSISGRIIENKRLDGCLEIEKNVPRYLELDGQRMIQIVLNLVSNAVKFTDKGCVRLRVSWQTTAASDTKCVENAIMQPSSNGEIEEDKEEEEGEENALFGDMREYLNTLKDSPSRQENSHRMTEYQKKFLTNKELYQLNHSKIQWNDEDVLSSKLPKGSQGILKIQVLDSGCGMTAEEQAKLFQKFSQVNEIAGQRKVGTGLGLWICKELANRLVGDIKTRSVVGAGSVFELNISTKVSSIIARVYSQNSLLTHTTTNTQAKYVRNLHEINKKKILLADDDSFNIELMKNYLKKFGISFLCAYDGEEAVSLFKKYHEEICFVITDNFMPKKTGTEAAIEIANFLEEKGKPKISIMCISGDVKVNVRERNHKYNSKPINFDRLKEELAIIYPQIVRQSIIN